MIIAGIVGASTVAKALLDLHDSELKDRRQQIEAAEQYFIRAAERAATVRFSNNSAARDLLVTSFKELLQRQPTAVDPPTLAIFFRSGGNLKAEAQARQCAARNFAIEQHRAVALDEGMKDQFSQMLRLQKEPWQCADVLRSTAEAGQAQQREVSSAAAAKIAATLPPPPPPPVTAPVVPAPLPKSTAAPKFTPAPQSGTAPPPARDAEVAAPKPPSAPLALAQDLPQTSLRPGSPTPTPDPVEVSFEPGSFSIDEKGKATIGAVAAQAKQLGATGVKLTSYDTGYNLLSRKDSMKKRVGTVADTLRGMVTVPVTTDVQDKVRPDRADGLRNQRWVKIELIF